MSPTTPSRRLTVHQLALGKKWEELAEILGQPHRHTSKNLNMALQVTAQAGQTDLVKELLRAGAYAWDFTAMRLAAINGHSECMELLLDAVNHSEKAVAEALFVSARHGHAGQVKTLLALRPGVTDLEAFMQAAMDGHADCLRLLDSPAIPDHERSQALWTALYAGHAACVAVLDGTLLSRTILKEALSLYGWAAIDRAHRHVAIDDLRELLEQAPPEAILPLMRQRLREHEYETQARGLPAPAARKPVRL